MIKFINTFLLFFAAFASMNAQQLDKFFEVDQYPYHAGLDSMVSIGYMIDPYADGEPDLSITHDGKELDLHYYEKTTLSYSDKLTYESKLVNKHLGLQETLQVKFNETGKPVYMKIEKSTSEMFNEEKTFEYDKKDRLIAQTRTGYCHGI